MRLFVYKSEFSERVTSMEHKKVKMLCEKAFSYTDDGFPGDEDNGTTAIWYIFGVLGFYPFCPGKPEYVKGKKQVIKSFINGKEFDADKYESVIPFADLP